MLQVLRAALIAADPAGPANMQQHRSLLKPEMIWQYEKGFSQSCEQVRHQGQQCPLACVEIQPWTCNVFDMLLSRHCTHVFIAANVACQQSHGSHAVRMCVCIPVNLHLQLSVQPKGLLSILCTSSRLKFLTQGLTSAYPGCAFIGCRSHTSTSTLCKARTELYGKIRPSMLPLCHGCSL